MSNAHDLPYRSRISSLSSVFPGEVYDIRLRPRGGDFRPPRGGGDLGLRQGAGGLGLRQVGGNLLGLRQRVGSLSLLPALAGVAPLLFRFGSGLRFGWSPMVATHGRFLSGLCRLRTWISRNVVLKPANFFADACVLRHPNRLLPLLRLRTRWSTNSTHRAKI